MDNISEFIRTNPKQAFRYAEEWRLTQKKYFIPPFDSRVEWLKWLSQSKLNINPNLWTGYVINQTLNQTVPVEHTTEAPGEFSEEGAGDKELLGLAILPFAFRRQREILEDDPLFQKIIEQKKEEWLRKNPGKFFSSKEGLDYLYGNPDDPDAPTLYSETEKAFREKYPKKVHNYDRRAKKIYKNHGQDPAIVRTKKNIEGHINARRALFEKTSADVSFEEFEKKIKDQEWDRFVKKRPEKAKAYRKNLSEIDNALERQEIRYQLSEYAKRTGKDIRLTQKIKHHAPEISVEEATKRLEAIMPASVPHYSLYVASQRTASPPSPQSSPLENHPSKRRGRGIVDYINNSRKALSSIKRASSSFRAINVALRTVGQIITKPFPWVWIIIIIILLIVIFQLFFGGGIGSSFDLDYSQNPNPSQSPVFPPIPGLRLSLNGPTFVNNGEFVSYSVTIFYDANTATTPIEEITVYNKLPQNTEFTNATGIYTYQNSSRLISWSLSETINQSGFSFTLRPVGSDFFLTNKVYAQAAPPATGGVCSEGFTYCSVQNLMNYFPDETTARQASIICNRESGSNPGSLNTNCNTNDYSVGLFQINLVAHCPGAYGPGRWGGQSCDNLLDVAKRDVCEQRYSNPTKNIQKAVEISSGGSYWVPWAAAEACGIIN